MAMDMPNVQPPTNTLDRFKAHIEDAGRKSLIDFGHNAAGTVPEEIPKNGWRVWLVLGLTC